MKVCHQFLTSDFGFCIIPSEKHGEARQHPSGCLSLMKDQKKSGSNIVTSRVAGDEASDSLNRFS